MRREVENKLLGMVYGEAPMCARVMGVKGALWVITEGEWFWDTQQPIRRLVFMRGDSPNRHMMKGVRTPR